MKKAILLLSTLFFLSCNVQRANRMNIANTDNSIEPLIQCYTNTATESPWSPFRVQDRKVEFRYETIKKDSLFELVTMITTGFNEGELDGDLYVEFKNGSNILLKAIEMESRDYLQSVNYQSTTPIMVTKTINDPGGTDIVIQADGTQKQVTRAASTKTVHVSENRTSNEERTTSQIFNRAAYKISAENLDLLKNNKILRYKMKVKSGAILIKPFKSQSKRIYDFINKGEK